MYQLPRISRTWNPFIIGICQSSSIAVRSVRPSSRRSSSVRARISSVRIAEVPNLRNYFPVLQFRLNRHLVDASRDLVRAVLQSEGCAKRCRIASLGSSWASQPRTALFHLRWMRSLARTSLLEIRQPSSLNSRPWVAATRSIKLSPRGPTYISSVS